MSVPFEQGTDEGDDLFVGLQWNIKFGLQLILTIIITIITIIIIISKQENYDHNPQTFASRSKSDFCSSEMCPDVSRVLGMRASLACLFLSMKALRRLGRLTLPAAPTIYTKDDISRNRYAFHLPQHAGLRDRPLGSF